MSSFDEIQNREAGLHKKLSAKQMGMIAIGGAIGTGLFMGSKFAISFAGPAVIVSLCDWWFNCFCTYGLFG